MFPLLPQMAICAHVCSWSEACLQPILSNNHLKCVVDIKERQVIAFLDRIVTPRALLARERVLQKDVWHRKHGLPHGRALCDAMDGTCLAARQRSCKHTKNERDADKRKWTLPHRNGKRLLRASGLTGGEEELGEHGL